MGGQGAKQEPAAAASASAGATSGATAPAAAGPGAPSGVEQVVTKLVTDYLNVEDCGDRVQFIVHPDKNGEVLKKHYADPKSCKRKFQSIDAAACQKPTGGRCVVKVNFGKVPGPFGREYDDIAPYCIPLEPTPKIDWRCSAGYNPVALKTFKALHENGKPSRFRVNAELSDYYNYEFRLARAKYYSIKITDKANEDVYGYVERESDVGKQIFELLKDGTYHSPILELEYKAGSKNPQVATITRMISKGWREYPEELQ